MQATAHGGARCQALDCMKLNTKLTSADWVKPLEALLRPRFVEVAGKVFQVWNAAGAAQCRRSYSSRKPQTVDENTDNHEHFWFFDGKTLAGVRNNFLLAEVVRLAWRDVLARQFPKKRFRLFVINEYQFDDDSEGEEIGIERGEEIGIETTLRLWTIDPKTAKDFDSCYRPESASADTVLLTQFVEKGHQPVSRVLEMVTGGEQHPQYRRAVASASTRRPLASRPLQGKGRATRAAG